MDRRPIKAAKVFYEVRNETPEPQDKQIRSPTSESCSKLPVPTAIWLSGYTYPDGDQGTDPPHSYRGYPHHDWKGTGREVGWGVTRSLAKNNFIAGKAEQRKDRGSCRQTRAWRNGGNGVAAGVARNGRRGGGADDRW